MTVRLYGVNKYGDGKLYGHTDEAPGLAWDISIDWDEDGFFDGNEAGRLTSVDIPRGRTSLLAPIGAGFESIQTGEAVISLRNADGRFDGWNTSSPLYPNVTFGKDVRIRVRDLGESNAIKPLLRGVITNIIPTGYGEDAQVQIHISDGLDFLRNYPARVAMQQDITPDEAIGLILDSVNWPSAWGRNLDVSAETIPYWWASGNKKAMSEIEDLATSFLGYFFVDASGQARYIKRSSVAEAVANYPQEYLLKDLGNPQPYTILRNITRIKVHPRTQAATGVIWQLLGNTPSVPTGAANALTMFANYTYNNVAAPAINVITPAATTDFLVNSQANGSGTNLTASCTVALTDFGDTAKLVITNNSGTLGYVTFLRIRGDAIYEPNVSDVTYPADLGTVTNPRELLFDLQWQQDLNVAVDLSNVLGPFYAGLHPMPNIKIDSRPSLQFAPDLFDIITADLGYIGLNGVSFRVGGIEHATDSQFENCQRVITRLYLEPYVSADNYMQWDTNSVWDTSTVFGY
jgi:hypothetical protein